jgi:hypothetical protein
MCVPMMCGVWWRGGWWRLGRGERKLEKERKEKMEGKRL